MVAATVFQLQTSAFPPLALGFMGLGTGYLIYGPQELFGYPKRERVNVDYPTGVWGIFMPGLMQLLTGLILFVGLTWFQTFTDPILYMAALAFSSYGVHWFAMGWNRMHGTDARVSTGMTIAFLLLSILGVIVFFKGHDAPVGGLFIGLSFVYISEFFVSLGPLRPAIGDMGERALGFFHIGTGLWLMYLVWAVTLDFTLKYTWPT